MKNINKYKKQNIIVIVGVILLLLTALIGLIAIYYGIWTWSVLPLVIKIIATCIVTFVTLLISLIVWANMEGL